MAESKREGKAVFVTMFSIVTLLYFNFSILRSVRNALVVADGGGAELLPFLELWAGLPSAIGLTWLLTRLCRRYSLEQVFTLVTLFFLAFFALFAFCLYPLYATQGVQKASSSLFDSYGPSIVLFYWPKALFFAVSELWKVGLLSVLFWSAANRSLRKGYAKEIYGPLLAGGSLGAILAGPVTSWCTASYGVTQDLSWQQSLYLVATILIAVGFVLIGLFRYLSRLLAPPQPISSRGQSLSLKSSMATFASSPSLILLCTVVLGDYLAYGLTEIVFLNTLKEAFSDPRSYCHYMGKLTFWAGMGTMGFATLLAPRMLTRLSWRSAALITPFTFLLTSLLFFGYTCWWSQTPNPAVSITLGSCMYCACRAAKYTFFDSTKELAYMHFDSATQLEGKLVIDGIGGRVGRASSSLINVGLIRLWGSVGAAAPFTGVLSALFVSLWVYAAHQLGLRLQGTELGTIGTKRCDNALEDRPENI